MLTLGIQRIGMHNILASTHHQSALATPASTDTHLGMGRDSKSLATITICVHQVEVVRFEVCRPHPHGSSAIVVESVRLRRS